MHTSCIIKHFENYSPLTERDRTLLASLEKSPRAYARNSVLWEQGEPSRHFYTVSKGWAYTYRNMHDGTRQVLDIYVPGDIVGLREFAFSHRITGLALLSDAELCAFPKTRLTDVFSQSLLLCNIFFMIAARDQAILLERLVNLGRRSAREKVAHFLVEIAERLKKTDVDTSGNLRLPLPQVLLADALGLSVVHINRTLKELKNDNLLLPTNGGVELLNIKALEEVAGFDPGYLEENIDDMLDHAREAQLRIDAAFTNSDDNSEE